jgi:hypothetical protein
VRGQARVEQEQEQEQEQEVLVRVLEQGVAVQEVAVLA